MFYFYYLKGVVVVLQVSPAVNFKKLFSPQAGFLVYATGLHNNDDCHIFYLYLSLQAGQGASAREQNNFLELPAVETC